MMKKLAHTVVFLALASHLCAEIDLEGYPFSKKLSAEDGVSGEIGSFPIDDDLMRSTVDGYVNLRVVDDQGRETPFLVRPVTGVKVEKYKKAVSVRKIAFEKIADNRVEIVLEKVKKGRPTSIDLVSAARNFEKKVTVYASSDRSNWQTVAVDVAIFDYSKYVDIRSCTVDIKPVESRYYKIEISNITEAHASPFIKLVKERRGSVDFSEVETTTFRKEDFRINGFNFWETLNREVSGRRKLREYIAEDFLVEERSSEKRTVVSYVTCNAPLTSIKLVTDAANFRRPVLVEGSHDGEEWSRVASGIASRMTAGSYLKEELAIAIPSGRRFSHHRVTVHNYDNPPLEIRGVTLEGEKHEALFFCDPDRVYTAVYGSDATRVPQYDIGEVISRKHVADAVEYLPGEERDNTRYDAAYSETIVSGKHMLIGAVLLMVLSLGWVITKVNKAMEMTELAGTE